MTWQNFAEAAVTRYVPDAAVRELVLAEIRGAQRSPDLRVRAHEIAFEAVGESRLPGLFAQRWPAYRRWYEQDGEARAAVARAGRRGARAAHARARADLVGARGRHRRRRARRTDAHAVRPAAAAERVLAGRAARGGGAGAQLRLRPEPLRCRRAGDAVRRHAGDRHGRPAVGPARRRQRPRARGVVHLRRPALRRSRLQRPDRRPLPARDVRDGRGGRRGAGADPGAGRVQRHARRPPRGPRDGLARPRRAGPRDRGPDRHQPPGRRGLARVRALDADRGAARPARRAARGRRRRR